MKKHEMLGLLVLIMPALINFGAYAAIPHADALATGHNSPSAGSRTSYRLMRSHPDYLNIPEASAFPLHSKGSAPETFLSAKNGSGEHVSMNNAGVTRQGGGIRGREVKLHEVNPWRSIGAVAFVLGGLLCISAFLRKRQGFGVKAGKHKSLKIIERLAFDSKRSIVLLEVDGRRLLVGAGSEHIEKLADLGPEGEDDDIQTSDPKWFQFSEKSRQADGVLVPGLRLAQGGAEKT